MTKGTRGANVREMKPNTTDAKAGAGKQALTTTTPPPPQPPQPPLGHERLIEVLQNSLYPGASTEAVALVIDYCRANNLDPLLKPVHIVPISVEVEVENPSYREGTNSPRMVKVWRTINTIMPGIGLYRIRAARAGDYMGLSEPEFGDDIEMELGGTKMVFPEWCTITAYKMINGEKVPFHATEYWLENYATAGRNTAAPNRMWQKRPRAQLIKCAKAQALREGWPDVVGAAPTAEEMEGQFIHREDPAGAIDTEATIKDPQPKRGDAPAATTTPNQAALPAHREPAGLTVEEVTGAAVTRKRGKRSPTPLEREREREADREAAHYAPGGKGGWVGAYFGDHDEQQGQGIDEPNDKQQQPAGAATTTATTTTGEPPWKQAQDQPQPINTAHSRAEVDTPASPGAVKQIKLKLEREELTIDDIRASFEALRQLESLEKLPASFVNPVLKWIAANRAGQGE